jgi:hypothetical protein
VTKEKLENDGQHSPRQLSPYRRARFNEFDQFVSFSERDRSHATPFLWHRLASYFLIEDAPSRRSMQLRGGTRLRVPALLLASEIFLAP